MSEETNQPRSRREEINAANQGATVREALGKEALQACVVDEGADLLDVCLRLSEVPGVDIVAVTGEAGRLKGIIPVRLLLDELFLQVAPEEFLADLRVVEGIEEFGKLSRARSARDLMQPAVYITMNDSVRRAFRRMHEERLEGLPVVDDEMRVVGYLHRLQLIQVWLRDHRREAGA